MSNSPLPVSRSFFANVRVVAEPRERIAGGKELLEVRFAFNPGGDRYESQFISATVTGKTAERAKTLTKGDIISVGGTVQHRKWKAKDGTENVRYEIPYPDFFVCPRNDAPATSAAADDEVPF